MLRDIGCTVLLLKEHMNMWNMYLSFQREIAEGK